MGVIVLWDPHLISMYILTTFHVLSCISLRVFACFSVFLRLRVCYYCFTCFFLCLCMFLCLFVRFFEGPYVYIREIFMIFFFLCQVCFECSWMFLSVRVTNLKVVFFVCYRKWRNMEHICLKSFFSVWFYVF